ncbi:histone-lysine N-methyltransferase SETD1B-like [Salvelinus namaycush]|uniref:Histone-lysine N-methyltransferase SETD1B-like n=1 Tax=Salvelinus namaycush TaxID=8040 RepID=A0A8U0UIH2_SALNM|nr:histone-lysine N-methyltransferase SETD1B-like [Salvelinus namaycush]
MACVVNVMENSHQGSHGEKHPQHWRSCKLIVDPALKNGFYKVYRYDGQHFNMPDLGAFPVDTVRDPRICRLWTKFRDTDLLVPKFKIDECYVGPPKEVTFARLNDNVREGFLTDMCIKYGQIEEVEILYNPKNKKHLGIAKVIFDTVKAAKDTVEHLHDTSVMGNIIHVELDPKGKNRMRYFHLLVSGLYTPSTLPLGSDEHTLQRLTDRLQVIDKPLQKLTDGSSSLTRSISSPTSVATPLSLDTAYSSIWQDTPGSFGLTPLSQGTPHTPCLSGTPLSQDSCYSSQHTTPVHQVTQGEHSSYGAHRRLRRDVCYRQPGRPYMRSHHQSSELSSLLKHLQPHRPLQPQTQVAGGSYKSSFFWYQNRLPSTDDNPATEPPLHLSLPEQESWRVPSLPPASEAFPLSSSSASATSMNVVPLRERPQSPPSGHDAGLIEPPPSPPNNSPGSPIPEAESHSLDSRIEMLLSKTQSSCLPLHGERGLEAEVHSQDSPVSPFSPVSMYSPESDHTPARSGCPVNCTHPTTRDGLEDVSPTPLPEWEGDESLPGMPSLIWTSQPPWPPGTLSLTQRERIYPYPLNTLHTVHMDKVNGLPGCGSVPVSFTGQPWPLPPFMPTFNPSVPPPGYLPLQEDLHKATVEKVLAVIMEELKSIVKRDINRKMVEGVAFRAFDEWWDGQEQKAKIAVTLVSAREGRVEVRTKPRDSLRQNIGPRGATNLPSFKVKKKESDDPTASEDPKRKCPYTPVNDAHESAELESNITNHTLDRSPKTGSIPAVRRRHARPLELDSEGEEESREKEGEPTRDKEEDTVAADKVPQRQQRDEDDDSEQKEEEVDDDEEDDEDVVFSKVTRGLQSPNEEVARVSLSEVESYSSEDSEYLSESDSSFEESEDFSDYDSSSNQETEEEEETDGDADEVNREVECVVLSSDEEEMDLEPPATPSAPLTPGTELDLLDGSEPVPRDQPGEEKHSVCLTRDVFGRTSSTSRSDPGMELLSSEHHHDLQAPSPIGLTAVVEPDFAVEIDSPEWSVESPDNVENLRPLTPTGSLGNSDSDLLFKSKPTPPAVEEVELPHTPGRGAEALLESEEDSMDHLLSLSPTNSEPLSQSRPTHPPALASYPTYEDMPKTPGRDERGLWNPLTPWRVPVTPGREEFSPTPCSPFPLPSLSTSLYIRTPRTPGRDFIPTKITHRNTTVMLASSQRTNGAPLSCDEMLTDSPVLASSPSSLSESSAETPGHGCVWLNPNPGSQRKIPLQGLENWSGLADVENQREMEKCSWRRVQPRMMRKMRRRMRWRMRRWQRMRSVQRAMPSVFSASPCRRSRSEEMTVLHSVWKEGLDEEDSKLLQVTYDRLLQQDNGFSWLSDTLWVPHPHILYYRAKRKELNDWMWDHVTGSARSEGFYKISKNDKIKYLNSTCLTTDQPSADTQGVSLSAQPHPSLRSGSEFRSEQRRLLSSFSCDSDLLRFNQLKFRKKRIRFCRSHIHDWGLFALEPIAADEMVIEYVGQCIRQVVADMREKRYEDEGIGSSYLFRVDQDTIIDATKYGNLARFINHSCNPNCYAKIITVKSQKKIVIYSRQSISVNEEITYDYKFPIEDEKIPCLCGAENCQGSLN